MFRGLKGLLATAAVGCAVTALATPAGAATNIYLDKGEMFNPVTVAFKNLSGNHYPTSNVLDGPVLFTANIGTTASANTFQFLGFCVDIFDHISPGINVPGTINDAYHTDTLDDNNGSGSTFHTVTPVMLGKIETLITYGTQIWNADSLTDPSHHISSTVANQLAAIQGAIWEIENPGLDVDGPAAVDSLISTYESNDFFATHYAGKIQVVVDSSGNPLHQSFAYAVPEPASWALMIVGLGGVGAVMRQRRRAAAAVA
jgi:hypothetical protein